jgi:hypothetical protein
LTGAISGCPVSGKSGSVIVNINGIGNEYKNVETKDIELFDYDLKQSGLVFATLPSTLEIKIGTVITDTAAVKVKDTSGNTLTNNTDVTYSVANDTTNAFKADGGLSVAAASGIISGTPVASKGIVSGTFCIKATPKASTD